MDGHPALIKKQLTKIKPKLYSAQRITTSLPISLHTPCPCYEFAYVLRGSGKLITENSMYDFTLNIYEANLQGTNVKMIFSKDGYKTHPWVYAIDEMFYVEFYSNNAFDLKSKLIDKYTISTGIYENIASGEDCSLSDYFQSDSQSRYSIEVVENISPQEHGEFIITDLENGITNIIDDDYLKDTIYIESMEKFNYSPMRFDISNDKILLTYGIGAGDGWNNAHLIFEYDFNSNKLKYQLLAFPDDLMNVKIIYIG